MNRKVSADLSDKPFVKFRKIPVTIEAYQTDEEVYIETLEGVMKANVGDWIIRGVKGELYPCKPESIPITPKELFDGLKEVSRVMAKIDEEKEESKST